MSLGPQYTPDSVDQLGERVKDVVRSVPSEEPSQPREVRGAVRLLVVSPWDEAAPAYLRAELRPSVEAGRIEWLDPLSGLRASESEVLQRLRSEPPPHILHFIGQGGGEASTPVLRLADKGSQQSWLPIKKLAEELEQVFLNLRLIVLEGLQGTLPGILASAAEQLAQAGANSVVAHLWPVQQKVAQAFSWEFYREFYRSLTATAASSAGDVARSFHDARLSALKRLKESEEMFSPVLYLRGRDSTRVFAFRESAPPASLIRAIPDEAPPGRASLKLWLSVPEPAALNQEGLLEALSAKYGAQGTALVRQSGKAILPVQLDRPRLPNLIQDAENGALDMLLSQAGGRFVQEISEGSRCLFSYIPPVTFLPPPSFEDVDSKEFQALLLQVDVVLFTTTQVERDALYAVLKPFPGRAGLIQGALHNNTYRLGQFGRYAVAHVQSTMGSYARDGSTLTMSDVITELKPKAVVIIGVAFGVKPEKQRLGDVIIAETVIPYEHQRVGPNVTSRGEPLRCGPILSERFRTGCQDWRLARGEARVNTFQGELLSGEKLVDDRSFRDALVEKFPNAYGGDMEGAGAYAAASRKKVDAILVKAISDWGDGAKTDRAQSFAAQAAVSLAHHVLGKQDVLKTLNAREHAPAHEARASRTVDLWEAPHLRPLKTLLEEPFLLLLGDSLLGDSSPATVKNFHQAMKDTLQENAWATPEGLPMSALAQRFLLQFGTTHLKTLFQSAFQNAPRTLPLVNALAQRLQPGFHFTLMRLPILERALAEYRSEFPLYVIHPPQSEGDALLVHKYQKGGDWVQLNKMPKAFDPKLDIVVLRLYRGYLAKEGHIAEPLLTEDDYLASFDDLAALLTEELAMNLRRALHDRPALLLGMSLLMWEHRRVLQCLYRDVSQRRNTVLLEPNSIEAEPWRKGRGLPQGMSAQVVSATAEELEAYLIGLQP